MNDPMNEEDDLVDSHHLPLSRLDQPAVIEGEAPPEREETVVPRGDVDSGRVEFVKPEDGMEDSRLGFADSRDREGVVVEAAGTRVDEGVVDGDDGSAPQGEALGREESGDFAGGGVGAGIGDMGRSQLVDAEEESGMVPSVFGVQQVEEGKDAFVGGVEGVVSSPPPAKELEEKTVHVAIGSGLEYANCSSLLGFPPSSPWEKEVVDGGQQTDAHLGDDNPMLVGCNKEVRTNSRCEAGQDVEVGNLDTFGGKDADVNAGKLKSVMLNDMDQSMGGTLGSAPINEKETVDVNPVLVGCNEEDRTSSQYEIEKEVEAGNADGFGGKDADVNAGELKSVILHDTDKSMGGTLGSSPVIEKGTGGDNPLPVGCNEEVRTSSPCQFRQEVKVGNVGGFGGKDADVNAGEMKSVMLHDMDQSVGGILGSAPVIEENTLEDNPLLVGCNEEVRTTSQSEVGQQVKVGNIDGFGGKDADVNAGELNSVMLHDMDQCMGGTSSSAPVIEETVEDNPMKMCCNKEARISSRCEAGQEDKVGNANGFGGKDADVNAGELKSVMLHDMDEYMVGSLDAAPAIEEEMVDAYGPQQFNNPTVDDKVMHVDVSPRSNVKEEAASGEVGTMMIHDADNSVTLTPEEEGDAAALPPVSVDEDAMVEDVTVAEEKELSTDMPVRVGGRKKRGRPPRSQASKAQTKKKVEEDVCFICFDGGDLVVCDRRGCPKVYHPSCVNRDEAFFRAKGRWNCGWHICSICEKSARYMCYTCTHSLCRGCVKETDFVCIRGNQGLCGTCRNMVMLIETNEQENKTVNFDDKSSWEFLFKDYWSDLKAKLSITLDEVAQAKNPSKRSLIQNDQSSDEIYEANDAAASSSDSSSGHHVRSSSAKKKVKRKSRTDRNDETLVNMMDSVGSSMPGDGEWASKELLEFVSHMRGADATMLSQFDVQALLLEYIKQNNLRDPRRKSQIICDSRLRSLFGKARVGHFEMLKLLESHFLIKETSQTSPDDYQGTIGDTDVGQTDLDGSNDAARKNSDKRRKARKKEERGLQNNFNDYAAVDVHNINLVYLRRNLMEDLLDDSENFHQKVVGAFVRIRISGSGQKQDMYRIVQVVGSTKASEIYKTGKKTTDISLEILNLNKTEVIRIDSISNQEFTEEECKRLRQSIKCGLICPMTVGELQDKAMTLQSVRVNDWLESEKLRLGHLRDRASEKGRRKELRECVEKLQLLNTPEEHTRRLNEIPGVHADPKMDPSYESAEEESDDRKRDNYFRPRDSVSSRKGRELMSSGKNLASVGSWNAGRGSSVAILESGRNVRDAHNYTGDRRHELVEAPADASRVVNAWSNSENVAGTGQSTISTSTSVSAGTGLSTASSINEAEKIWHYQDPSGKIQGPFSMVQLRKWNSTGYFPRDLKIWKTSENQEDSILLTDALNGNIQELPKTAIGMDKFMSAQSSTVISTGSNWNLAKNSSSTLGLKQAQSDPLSAVSHPGKPAYDPNSHGMPQSISGEIGKVQVPNGSLHNSENNSYNLSTTPKPSTVTGSWVGGHVVDNNLAAGQPMSASWDANSSQNVSAYQSLPAAFQPNSTTTGWVDKSRTSSSGWTSNVSSFPAVKTTEPLDHAKQFGSIQSLEQTDGFCRSQKSAALDHGLNPEVSNQGEMRSSAGANTYHSLVCPSPTPKNEESKSFPMDSEQQKSFTSSISQNVRTDTGAVSTSEMISNKFPDLGDGMRQSQFQRQEPTVKIPHSPSGDMKSSVATNSSEWSMPSPTPGTGTLGLGTSAKVSQVHNPASNQWQTNPSQAAPQTPGDQDARTSQNNTNIGWGTVQGNAAISWGALAQGNASLGWINSAQGGANVNMGWGSAGQSNPTASMVWRVPGQGSANINAGQGTAVQGNPNPNTGWGIVAPLNAVLNSNWPAPAQGYPNVNPSWVPPTQENAGPNGSWAASANTNTNARWGAQTQGNPNGNAVYGSGNGNVNTGWNSSGGKNSNTRGSHHREDRERHSGHGDRGFQGKPYGHGGGRQRVQPSGGGPSRPPEGGPRGVCKFHENGHCRKGSSCNFLHT